MAKTIVLGSSPFAQKTVNKRATLITIFKSLAAFFCFYKTWSNLIHSHSLIPLSPKARVYVGRWEVASKDLFLKLTHSTSHSQVLQCSSMFPQWGADSCFWQHTWAPLPTWLHPFTPQKSERYLGNRSLPGMRQRISTYVHLRKRGNTSTPVCSKSRQCIWSRGPPLIITRGLTAQWLLTDWKLYSSVEEWE